jgi:TolA-binding protein
MDHTTLQTFVFACVGLVVIGFGLFFKNWMDSIKEGIAASNEERADSNHELSGSIKELNSIMIGIQRAQDKHGFQIHELKEGLKEVQNKVEEKLGRRITDSCPQEDCPLLRQQRLDAARATHPGGRLIPVER